MEYADKMKQLWAAGSTAPYDLYDHEGTLVEAISTGAAPIIKAGDLITDDIALRVADHHANTGAKITVEALVWNKDGSIKLDKDGNPVTEDLEVDDDSQPLPLTHVERAPEEAPTICDQCGNDRDELFPIGKGRYCKVERDVAGAGKDTCYNVRLKQLGAA